MLRYILIQTQFGITLTQEGAGVQHHRPTIACSMESLCTSFPHLEDRPPADWTPPWCPPRAWLQTATSAVVYRSYTTPAEEVTTSPPGNNNIDHIDNMDKIDNINNIDIIGNINNINNIDNIDNVVQQDPLTVQRQSLIKVKWKSFCSTLLQNMTYKLIVQTVIQKTSKFV